MANAIAYQKNSLEIQKPAVEVLTEFRSRSTYSSFSKNFILSLDTHPCNDDLRLGILLLFLHGGRTVGFFMAIGVSCPFLCISFSCFSSFPSFPIMHGLSFYKN
jgi:hypothetical protein